MTSKAGRVGVWIVGLAIVGSLIGCGGGSAATPALPEAVRTALSEFCSNAGKSFAPFEGVAGAGHVIAEGRNHLVAFDASGNESGWAAAMPAEWRPATLADTELVACVQDNVTEVFETCTYIPSGKVTRARFRTFAEVYEAATGREIWIDGLPHLAFQGIDPPPCPETNPSSVTLEGERVAWATIQPRLERLVAGMGVGTVTVTLTGGSMAGTYSLLDPNCALGRTNPGVWQVEALDKEVTAGLSYFYFLGYDGPGFTDLSSINPDAKLLVEITIGPYSVLARDSLNVVVAKTTNATVGDGEFTVEAANGSVRLAFTGHDASGTDIVWTAFCPSYVAE